MNIYIFRHTYAIFVFLPFIYFFINNHNHQLFLTSSPFSPSYSSSQFSNPNVLSPSILHMDFHTELALELSLNPTPSMPENATYPTKKPNPLEPCLTLALSGDSCGGSSFSNASVKREREVVSDENNASGEEDEDGGVSGKKKLRLTKAQSGLLEEAFKLHTALSPKQKQELARDLKLRPRQVEVWFQNRRARTKLKQTEVDCEYLKKCCKILTDENERLRQEVKQLKAHKVSPPMYMKLPATTLTMCPSCEQTENTKTAPSKTSFTMAPKPYFFNPVTNSSAAC